MCGGKFAFKNRLGSRYSWKEIYRYEFCVTSFGGLYLEGLIFGILRYPENRTLD